LIDVTVLLVDDADVVNWHAAVDVTAVAIVDVAATTIFGLTRSIVARSSRLPRCSILPVIASTKRSLNPCGG
jgi:hypothetical protein